MLLPLVQPGYTAFLPVLSFTIWILEDGECAVAVFIVGELVIVETLVKFIRSDQGWRPRRGICVKDKMEKFSLKEQKQAEKPLRRQTQI